MLAFRSAPNQTTLGMHAAVQAAGGMWDLSQLVGAVPCSCGSLGFFEVSEHVCCPTPAQVLHTFLRC